MKGKLKHLIQRFPVSILLVILLLISMWANKRYTDQIKDLCAAGGVLYQEASIAWEGLDDLAPGNLERNQQRWHWAQEQFMSRCMDAM